MLRVKVNEGDSPRTFAKLSKNFRRIFESIESDKLQLKIFETI